MKPLLLVLALALSFSCAAAAEPAPASAASPSVVADGRCYELRTYYTHPGRLEALHARFRNHTIRLFEKHGMKLVGFWVPQDADKGADHTLVYLVEYPSRDAAARAWAAFRADPEWIAVRTESEKDGPIVVKVDSVYLHGTDYSALK